MSDTTATREAAAIAIVEGQESSEVDETKGGEQGSTDDKSGTKDEGKSDDKPEDKGDKEDDKSGDKPDDEKGDKKDEEDGDKDGEKDSDLPEWARKKLSRANSEAASFRTQLREAQEALKGAKTVEEFEAATATLNAKIENLETELLRERVARNHNLPDDLAARLQGKTKEELEADAKALQKYVTHDEKDVDDLEGGLDGDNSEEGFDPVKAAANVRKRRY